MLTKAAAYDVMGIVAPESITNSVRLCLNTVDDCVVIVDVDVL